MECSMGLVQTIDDQVSVWEKQETQSLEEISVVIDENECTGEETNEV